MSLREKIISLTDRVKKIADHLKTHNTDSYIVPHNKLPMITPDATVASVSYTPQQFQSAYGLNSIVTPKSALRGAGITIGIIKAYHYANLVPELQHFCSLYNLAVPNVPVVILSGKYTC